LRNNRDALEREGISMRKRPGLFVVLTASAVLIGVAVGGLSPASATPPTGQFSATDHGRVQQATSATVTIPPADNVSSNYVIAPGGDTGWRTSPGDSVIAVFKGALALEQAQGCSSQELAAGKAVVIPAGKFRLHNAGNQPAEISGVFFNLRVGGPSPLVEGQVDPAPACAGFSAAAVGPTGISAADSARGTTGTGIYTIHGHGVGGADAAGTVVHSLEAGKDLFVVTYTFEPGASTGWLVHTDEMAILTKGTIAIWEGHDGKCEKAEEYHAGQAWAHKPHKHMGVNESNETAVVRIIGFNMKHGQPMPVVGSNMDHIDFSQAPPADCPRLR
jgi:quercetin dioxygenase-like cupin family protein